ncbi:hypothetical protein N8H41_21735 [Pseudomonas vlassakiae]|uniref:5'-methylthioadenosine/S-adenosylhomocysteine nucleosidase family protein n=1 Tax=Pseudomonas vlassakiae TaxID=485888 RepID=UPI0021C68A90|nr:hypothetical protein [Pseudomonas vlassakiae]MCU0126606.1 hypothetical protein [Pseudomonas vlassakiae]
MRRRVKLQWLVITELNHYGADSLSKLELLFNRKGGRSFLRSIGGHIRTTYAPIVLEPNDIFYSAMSRLQKQVNFSGKKFPYTINDFFEGKTNRLNVGLHLFGQTLAIRLSLDEFEINESYDLSFFQLLDNHPRIKKIALQLIAIVISGDRHASGNSNLPKSYPAIRLESLQPDPEDWKKWSASLLCRHAAMLDSVLEHVLDKNQAHQVDHSQLLIDKQGIVSYVPFSYPLSSPGNQQRYSNAYSMLELAAVLKSQLSKAAELPEDAINLITNAEEAIADSVSAQRAWNLICREFKLRIELKNRPQKPAVNTMKRVLIVTVTHVESQAVLSAFHKANGQAPKAKFINGHIYQELGAIGIFDCFLAISEMGAGGTGGSTLSVKKAIEEINPDSVIMTGIAFGIDKRNFSIGDILVSNQVQLYDLQKLHSNGKLTIRGDKPHASSTLLNWVSHAKLSWTAISKSKVESGLILSGDKLIDNVDYRDLLADQAPEALGGEMEGAGLYAACHTSKVDWLLIKAICDWADGNKSKNKTANQLKAANNAASFVTHLLGIIN